MPGKPGPILFWLYSIKELAGTRNWLRPGAVFGAAGMLVLAGLLMITVVSGIKEGARQATDAAQLVNNKQNGSEHTVLAAKQDSPAPVAASTGTKEEISKENVPALPMVVKNEPRWPVRGEIGLGFGWNPHPVYNDWRFHTGLDISVPEGTPVQSMFGGEVTDVFQDNQLGQAVTLAGGKYTVTYASLATVAVRKGQQLKAGARIGTAGSSSGEPYPHLHLAIKTGDKFRDPAEILGKID